LWMDGYRARGACIHQSLVHRQDECRVSYSRRIHSPGDTMEEPAWPTRPTMAPLTSDALSCAFVSSGHTIYFSFLGMFEWKESEFHTRSSRPYKCYLRGLPCRNYASTTLGSNARFGDSFRTSRTFGQYCIGAVLEEKWMTMSEVHVAIEDQQHAMMAMEQVAAHTTPSDFLDHDPSKQEKLEVRHSL
jgi:hypothetical protein